MRVERIAGRAYRIPDGLNDFQLQIYVHLIDWKWANITIEPGTYEHRGRQIHYDAMLPSKMLSELPVIYRPVAEELRRHQTLNRFRIHTHFNHMASSQAATVNLFLPLLKHPLGGRVLAAVKPDFATLAIDQLDHGYCLEYWGGNFQDGVADSGPLGDKSALAGTDSDIAIAYRNHSDELCLWLIEHKLTESEFTPCGGFKSKDRKNHPSCDCTRTVAEIVEDKNACFHHLVRARKYWTLTERNVEFFGNHGKHKECPFRGGMNQLWRNQLLALSIEQDERTPFSHGSFSVARHPANIHLNDSLDGFKDLVNHNPKFSVFTSADVLSAAETLRDEKLDEWAKWYRALYML